MKKQIFLLLFFVLAVVALKAQVIEIDDDYDIKYNNRPIVIELYATWCAPCRAYAPIFNRLAREYKGRVDFYRIDIDNPDAEDYLDMFPAQSVPTTYFLWSPRDDGEVKKHKESGLMKYSELKANIEATIRKQGQQRNDNDY